MSTVSVVATRVVAAPADAVYPLIAGFKEHRRRYLPPNFSEYEVEEGGVGAGTLVRYTLNAGGRSRSYRVRVDEPSAGRVLRESDTGSSLVTSFTVTPDGAHASRVRIETTWQGAPGVGGFFERLFAPGAVRRIYDDELARLDGYARGRQAEGAAGSR